MSRPPGVPIDAIVRRFRHGIVVGLYPSSDPNFGVELQRKNGTANSTFASETIRQWGDTYGSQALQYADPLPNDGKPRSYRARHTEPNYTAGAWTSWVTAVPAKLPDSPIPDTIRSVAFRCRLWHSTDTTNTHSGSTAFLPVPWNSETFDVGNLHNTASSANPDVVIPPMADGLYDHRTRITYTGLSGKVSIVVTKLSTGTTTHLAVFKLSAGVSPSSGAFQMADVASLKAYDMLTVYSQVNLLSTGSITIKSSDSSFAVYRVGA